MTTKNQEDHKIPVATYSSPKAQIPSNKEIGTYNITDRSNSIRLDTQIAEKLLEGTRILLFQKMTIVRLDIDWSKLFKMWIAFIGQC